MPIASAPHAYVYRASHGRVGKRVGRQPVLLLTTLGRRSGRWRTTPARSFPVVLLEPQEQR